MKPYSWRAAILKSNLAPTTRHVLLTLSCYINDVGQSAYPSIATLAKNTGLSERAVITHLQTAKEKGFLSIGKHGFAGRRWAHNEYFPRLPCEEFAEVSPVDKYAKRGEPHAPLDSDGVNLTTSRGEPNDTHGVNDVHTNYPLELSSKQSIGEKKSDTAVDKVPKATAKRLPEDWVLPKKWGEWSLSEFASWNADHVRLQAEMFKDHWMASGGQNARKVDWLAAWRNWCRKAPSPAQAKSGGTGLPWYSTDALIIEKGQSLGLQPLAGETMNAFKGRIQAKISNPNPPPPEEKPAVVVRGDGLVKLGAEIGSGDLRRAAIEQAKRLTSGRQS